MSEKFTPSPTLKLLIERLRSTKTYEASNGEWRLTRFNHEFIEELEKFFK